MTLYESRPSRIEAVRWTGGNPEEIEEAIGADKASTTVFGDGQLYLLAGKDGAQDWVPVPVGHWVVHQPGDLSDVWPVDDDYFQAKYSPVGVPLDE
jgi:hypothetical protein